MSRIDASHCSSTLSAWPSQSIRTRVGSCGRVSTSSDARRLTLAPSSRRSARTGGKRAHSCHRVVSSPFESCERLQPFGTELMASSTNHSRNPSCSTKNRLRFRDSACPWRGLFTRKP
eukprot:6338117-Prymnesium_polylepis.1